MIALLSFSADKWQSVQVLVSVLRVVCGKCGAKAWELKPLAEIGACFNDLVETLLNYDKDLPTGVISGLLYNLA